MYAVSEMIIDRQHKVIHYRKLEKLGGDKLPPPGEAYKVMKLRGDVTHDNSKQEDYTLLATFAYSRDFFKYMNDHHAGC